MNYTSLKTLYEEAVSKFPVEEKQATGLRTGKLEAGAGEATYSEEYNFTAGVLLGKSLPARGWITLHQDAEHRVRIYCEMRVIHTTQWKDKITEQEIPLKAFYYVKSQTWNFTLLQLNRQGAARPDKDTLERLLEALVSKQRPVQPQAPFPIREFEQVFNAGLTRLENAVTLLVNKVLEKVPH